MLAWVCEQFGITDFVLQLNPSEEQDEMAEKERFSKDADNAKKMLDMGFDVKFENNKFTFSGQAQKPQPPAFGGAGLPGLPNQAITRPGIDPNVQPRISGEPAMQKADIKNPEPDELDEYAGDELIKSGHVEREYLNKRIEYNAPHAAYIEFGTNPHWPPFKPLRDWTWRNRANLGISDKDVDSVAYLICRKIAAEGTEEQPFIRPAVDFIVPKVSGIIQNAMR